MGILKSKSLRSCYHWVKQYGLIFFVLCVASLVFTVLVGNIIRGSHERPARDAIYMAVGRMEKIDNVADHSALLHACEASTIEKVVCKLDDYPITYRGYHTPASRIAVMYYQVWHEGANNIPFVTATVHIDRQPRFHVERLDY